VRRPERDDALEVDDEPILPNGSTRGNSARCVVTPSTCGWLGDSRGRTAGDIERDAAAGPTLGKYCLLQAAGPKKEAEEITRGRATGLLT